MYQHTLIVKGMDTKRITSFIADMEFLAESYSDISIETVHIAPKDITTTLK